MKRIVRITGCLFALVAALAESRGQPCPTCPIPPDPRPAIQQLDPTPEAVCRGWCLEWVAENTWDLTVQFLESPPGLCAEDACQTRYFVTVPTGQSVVIRKLTILRPVTANVLVELGQDAPGSRLTRVDEIYTEPQGQNGLNGSVRVTAYVEDSFGTVTNVNSLRVSTKDGLIEGPISCVMHPGSDLDPYSYDIFNKRNSYIELYASGSGSLLGDVTMAPSPGPNPVPGIITAARFPQGTIGTGTTSTTRVNIHADGAIGNVLGRTINADIGGTGIDGMDSFASFLGRMETTDPGGGTFDGEVRAERACVAEEYDLAGPYLYSGPWIFRGPNRGRLWLRQLNYLGAPKDAFVAMPCGATGPCAGLPGTVSFLDIGQGQVDWGRPVALKENPQNSPLPDNSRLYFTSDDAGGYTPEQHPAADLGGGAVGAVPFPAHTDDFNPPLPIGGPLRPTDSKTELAITVRYYGPVRAPATGEAFTVHVRRLDHPDEPQYWEDLTASFPASLNGPGTAVLLSLGHKMPGGYAYRVAAVGTLYCDLPDPSLGDVPVIPFGSGFEFQICDEVPWGDANSDGTATFADITSVLENWLAAGPLLLGDADKSGVVDFADITEVLEHWNATYCVSGAQSLLAKADGLATMDLDQDAPMTADDAAGVITAALIQMGYESIESFSDALNHMTPEEQAAEMRTLGSMLPGGQE